MVKYNFKDICVVPSADNFIDIMLSKTNRQTPTIVRARWKMSSIRQFYMRKIKFTEQNMVLRLNKILNEFPQLDNIHPFYSDLMNVLYDRDHYKIALSQLNICKSLIISISRDYIKLLKYGDSLYRCKQLKISALGRMVKILKKQSPSLLYLEEVRKHISRLPNINPNEKTILLIGYPSTGKSSFINNICKNTNIRVAAYPFTTKSLYIGHTHFNYLRYQIIDSPGILDRKLSARNTIEMQTITALAHLNSIILYFIDISLNTYYTIKQQCNLFKSLIPLFGNKPIIIICNKIDLRKFDQLSNDEQNLINSISKLKNVKIMFMSNKTETGCVNIRNEACNMLLSYSNNIKTSSSLNKLKNIENRLFRAEPIKRDNKERKSISKPSSSSSSIDKMNKSIKQIELENGGPGVFNFDVRNHWKLKNNDWKNDVIPQFYNGKNINDYYTKNIDKNLNLLENEEEKLVNDDIARNNDNDNNDNDAFLNDDNKLLANYIQQQHDLKRAESSRNRKVRDSRPQIPRTLKKISINKLNNSLNNLGINTSKIISTIKIEDEKKQNSLFNRRGRSRIRKSINNNNNNNNDNVIKKSGLDLQEIARKQSRIRNKSLLNRSRSRSRSRSRVVLKPSKGISSINASKTAQKLKRQAIYALNKQGKVHESDRRIDTKKPLHLFKVKHHPKGR